MGDVNFGGLNRADSEVLIQKHLDKYSQNPVSFVLDDEIYDLKIAELGIEFDYKSTAEQLYFIGQSKSYFEELEQFYASYFKKSIIKPVYNLNEVTLTDLIDRQFTKYEKAPKNAKFQSANGLVSVEESLNGEVLNRGKIVSDLAEVIDNLNKGPIMLEPTSIFADINTAELNTVADEYKSVINRRVIMTWNYDNWQLEGADLVSMLEIDRIGNIDGNLISFESGKGTFYFKNLRIGDSTLAKVDITIDESKLNIYLNAISKVINRPAINATANFSGDRIVNFNPAVDGQELNIDATKAQILAQLNESSPGNKNDINIKLPVSITTASIVNDQINSLGIKELIGKGVSFFSGSIANRIFNIELGAIRINGTLVAPGEIFSFNNTVGEVSAKTGYKQAYIISKGRTVLDDGGGICQVSTTIFRAVLNSGLPIVSRTAHAYRVGYYEQRGFGPGLDATVFSPTVDFKFKNDTEKHILIQTVFDRVNSSLEVSIYGTHDGRTVNLGKPIILSRTPALPEIRQEDPTLPKGTIKQVDFAAEGASVYFTRKVYKNGEILYDDTIKSNFKPWQAIYLIGTGG